MQEYVVVFTFTLLIAVNIVTEKRTEFLMVSSVNCFVPIYNRQECLLSVRKSLGRINLWGLHGSMADVIFQRKWSTHLPGQYEILRQP
jgi:hypothetical protein